MHTQTAAPATAPFAGGGAPRSLGQAPPQAAGTVVRTNNQNVVLKLKALSQRLPQSISDELKGISEYPPLRLREGVAPEAAIITDVVRDDGGSIDVTLDIFSVLHQHLSIPMSDRDDEWKNLLKSELIMTAIMNDIHLASHDTRTREAFEQGFKRIYRVPRDLAIEISLRSERLSSALLNWEVNDDVTTNGELSEKTFEVTADHINYLLTAGMLQFSNRLVLDDQRGSLNYGLVKALMKKLGTAFEGLCGMDIDLIKTFLAINFGLMLEEYPSRVNNDTERVLYTSLMRYIAVNLVMYSSEIMTELPALDPHTANAIAAAFAHRLSVRGGASLSRSLGMQAVILNADMTTTFSFSGKVMAAVNEIQEHIRKHKDRPREVPLGMTQELVDIVVAIGVSVNELGSSSNAGTAKDVIMDVLLSLHAAGILVPNDHEATDHVREERYKRVILRMGIRLPEHLTANPYQTIVAPFMDTIQAGLTASAAEDQRTDTLDTEGSVAMTRFIARILDELKEKKDLRREADKERRKRKAESLAETASPAADVVEQQPTQKKSSTWGMMHCFKSASNGKK